MTFLKVETNLGSHSIDLIAKELVHVANRLRLPVVVTVDGVDVYAHPQDNWTLVAADFRLSKPNAHGHGTAAPAAAVDSDVRRCRHVDDVPYTAMQAGAPTTWTPEPCRKPAMGGCDYCRSHAWLHDEHVAPNANLTLSGECSEPE